MPSVLRQSGPKHLNANGEIITPRAMVHFCEACGWEGAAFGDTVDGVRVYFCGWDGRPVCVGKGNPDGTRT